jgi:hypothetical protein
LAIGTLGGLLALSLAGAITVRELHGRIDASPCPPGLSTCTYDLTGHYAAGYALSGLLAGGLVLAFTLPERRGGRTGSVHPRRGLGGR